MEQVNPGVSDLEDQWREIGRYRAINDELARLAGTGWDVSLFPRRGLGYARLVIATVSILGLVAIGYVMAGALVLVALMPLAIAWLLQRAHATRASTKRSG